MGKLDLFIQEYNDLLTTIEERKNLLSRKDKVISKYVNDIKNNKEEMENTFIKKQEEILALYDKELKEVEKDYLKMKKHYEDVYNSTKEIISNIITMYLKKINNIKDLKQKIIEISMIDIIDYLLLEHHDIEEGINKRKTIYSYDDEFITRINNYLHHLERFYLSFDEIMKDDFFYNDERMIKINKERELKEEENEASLIEKEEKTNKLILEKEKKENDFNKLLDDLDNEIKERIKKCKEIEKAINKEIEKDPTYLSSIKEENKLFKCVYNDKEYIFSFNK